MKLIKSVFKYCVLVLLFMQTSYLASGQSDAPDIQGKFDDYRQHVLQEKIFVHTDKAFYLAGEILWFKIYIVDGTFHKPVDVSKVAYVELLDNESRPVLQDKIALKNGSGNGSFYIPVSVNSGNYTIRAYTNLMKNFSPDYFFRKNITIVNTLKAMVEKAPKTEEQYDVQFFPEGGNLVRDIQGKIAFRVVNSAGRGINFSGSVVDENSEVVVKFLPQKFGIGNFLFTPGVGHTYKAIITPEGKAAIVKNLPEVYDHGYVLSLSDNENGTLTVKIRSNAVTSASQGQQVYLFAHARQMIKIAEKINLNKGNAEFNLNKDILGEGISTFTLFNSAQQPVCERLYFGWPHHKLGIDIKTSAEHYSPRGKVTLEISSRINDGVPGPADLSVAVYRRDSLQTIDPCNIFNYLWLSSDLIGNVESPEYYFNKKGAVVDQAMDNLMLTQGWRRFNWDEVLQNKTPVLEFLPEYEGHIIQGKITDIRTNDPAGNMLTYLSMPGYQFQFYNSTSNSKGELSFYTHDFYKSGDIVVQPACEYEPFYKLEIENPFSEKYTANPTPDLLISARQNEEFLNHSIGMQVQNIYSGKALSEFTESITDSLAFFERPDRKYFLDDYTRFATMEEVIREYVSGVTLTKKKNNFYVKLGNDQQMSIFDNGPLVLLDGIAVCDFTDIINYDPMRVKKIETLNRKYYSGPLEFEGIISFSTYKGNYADLKLNPNALVIDYDGLQKQRQFYSPVYDSQKQISNRVPDFRNLLYWSPNINTSTKGKASLSFYTADQTGEYIIMIQGLSANGNFGSQIIPLIVK